MTTVPVDTSSDHPMLDLGQTRLWIESFYADSPHLLHISSTSDWRGACFAYDQLELLLAHVARLDRLNVQGIYLRACTLAKQPAEGRGTDDDSAEFPGFWADMDLAGPGHKTTRPLPPDVESAKLIIKEARLPEPTVWVHSGGGLYPWWMLRNLELVTSQNRDHLRNLSARWHDLIAAGATQLNLHYGVGTHDLSRVLRLPGTVNRKLPEEPRACHILEWGGPLYDLETLNDAAGQAQAMLEKRVRATAPIPRATPTSLDDDTPLNDYERRTDWAEILEPEGWTLHHKVGGTRYWTRPGKRPGEGHSATTGHDAGRDRLFVFSTETDFEPMKPYTKPGAYALLRHGGDFKAAARTLVSLGFGHMKAAREDAEFIREPLTPKSWPIVMESLKETVNTPSEETPPPEPVSTPASFPAEARYSLTEVGNAQRMVDKVGAHYRYIDVERTWYRWAGNRWAPDKEGHLSRVMHTVGDDVMNEARDARDMDQKLAKRLYAWANSSQMSSHIDGSIKQFRAMAGISVPAGSFDRDSHLLNVRNGIMNLKTLEFTPHDPKMMLSKMFNATYDPMAQAPNWLAFIERAFPDEEVRDYLQRALGYSILGEADQRAIFLLHGPSGTGKSVLAKTMEMVSGDYAASASASTFKLKRGETISNDVHDLRGKRFVCTSETTAGAVVDEELVKRITGGDSLTTRALYQENQTWHPQCVIWMATNHLPQLNSDDDAMWRRVKPIAMNEVIGREEEIGGFARNVLAPEADGILNWLLEGVRKYRERGLIDEPQLIKDSVANYKLETDSVALFISDSLADGALITGPEERIGTALLYRQYSEWCNNNMVRPLGARRFKHRMETAGYTYLRSYSSWWVGIGANLEYGVLGTMRN